MCLRLAVGNCAQPEADGIINRGRLASGPLAILGGESTLLDDLSELPKAGARPPPPAVRAGGARW